MPGALHNPALHKPAQYGAPPEAYAARMRRIAHCSDLGRWELVRCRPHPALSRHVLEYQGYRESPGLPVRRREMPDGNVVLIINFGAPWLIGDETTATRLQPHTSFTGGVYDRYAISESTGGAHCMQVDFTPLGAGLFFRVPMRDLACRVFGLDDVLGADADRLVSALYEARDWPRRFALLEAEIARRVLSVPAPPDLPAHIWERIVATGGSVGIGALAEDLGVSRKHLSVSFRDAVGLSPAAYARIRRFRRAAMAIGSSASAPWSQIALDCGYYDQAHFNRDFRRFSGYTPREFRHRALADGTGVIDA